MSRRPSLPVEIEPAAHAQEGLVSFAQALDAGVSRQRLGKLVEVGMLVRVTRGVYDTDPTPIGSRHPDRRRMRAVHAARLAFGPDAILIGKCALVVHGVRGLPVRITPEAALPSARRIRSRNGIVGRQFDNDMSVTDIGGMAAVTVDWALAQAVPECGREVAVSLMDSSLNRGLLTSDGLRRAHALARGRRGVASTHEWWDLADDRAQSPLESRARLDCIDHGLPPDQLQVPLRDLSGVTRYGDIGWRDEGGKWVIGEIDGAEHHDVSTIDLDMRRHNDLTAIDARVFHFRRGDVYTRGRIPRTIRAALRR